MVGMSDSVQLYFLGAQCPEKTWDTSLDKVKFCTRRETEHSTLYDHSGNIKHSLTNSEAQMRKKKPILCSCGTDEELVT